MHLRISTPSPAPGRTLPAVARPFARRFAPLFAPLFARLFAHLLARLAAPLAALALALAGAAAAAVAADLPEPAPREVRDPYYGVSLFDYFQEHYFSSLTDLMVAGHFNRLSHSTDEAEVLRGGLLLSYGLDREATDIFTRLIDTAATPPVRDRAWFYLAKIRYQKGMLAEAEANLGRIKNKLPSPLEEDRLLLQANLMMLRGAYAPAAALLKPRADDASASVYERYNLGVALVRSGSVARGSEILDEIGVEPADTDELRSVRDKANVALGFAALQNKDPERARVYLSRVRLNGVMASRALLGTGWAADQMIDPKVALIAWGELATRDTSDPAVLEALLAVPYALAEIGANAPALENYGKALAAYDQANTNIDASIAVIRSGKFLDGIISANPGDELGWSWKIDRLPGLPSSGHLAEVMAQNAFQEAFKSYRDLRFLEKNLQDWNQKLAILDDMLANRRQAFAQRLPQIMAGQRRAGTSRLDARRDAVVAELGAAQEQADGVAFADAREQALAQRLDRVRRNLAALEAAPPAPAVAAAGPAVDPAADPSASPPPDLAAARDRYRRVSGALGWELAQAFPARLWEAKKSLQQLNASLQELHVHDNDLVGAQANEPQRFDALAQRISALRDRVIAMQPRITELAMLQQLAVQELAVAELEQQRERLAAYGNQACFAIAEIYDRATLSRDAAHAPPK